eukprot:TRINITY_DN47972_c0_g1_i1.p1 TRINITY_DN47972_c0_g1~~TRINITY_DN47972_c0_g1_i1.p1  ORF type:complete len:279 (+),score=26.97 TRINITY_DN47972_c0_g1_i1:70-906(+)
MTSPCDGIPECVNRLLLEMPQAAVPLCRALVTEYPDGLVHLATLFLQLAQLDIRGYDPVSMLQDVEPAPAPAAAHTGHGHASRSQHQSTLSEENTRSLLDDRPAKRPRVETVADHDNGPQAWPEDVDGTAQEIAEFAKIHGLGSRTEQELLRVPRDTAIAVIRGTTFTEHVRSKDAVVLAHLRRHGRAPPERPPPRPPSERRAAPVPSSVGGARPADGAGDLSEVVAFCDRWSLDEKARGTLSALPVQDALNVIRTTTFSANCRSPSAVVTANARRLK